MYKPSTALRHGNEACSVVLRLLNLTVSSPKAQVKLLPWDVAIWNSREAYLAHNLAWQEYLAAAALDPIELTRDQAAINDTFLEFEKTIVAAVPDPALFDLDMRVAHLFIDQVPADAPEGPMQAAGLLLAA